MDVCNMDEAKRAMDIAEQKLSDNDYDGAKEFVNKAQCLYPNLDGLKHVLTIVDVFISAFPGGKDGDWYGVLGVDPWADDETMKKQYKKLALLLHPDKNKFNGAEDAFKLVLGAWDFLSDKVTRDAYDRYREWKEEQTELKRQRAWRKAEMEERIARASRIKRSPNQQKPSSSKKYSANSSREGKGDFLYDFMF